MEETNCAAALFSIVFDIVYHFEQVHLQSIVVNSMQAYWAVFKKYHLS